MLQKLKRNLRIIGEYEDEYLRDILECGKGYLNGLIGVKLDYEEAEPQALLMDYARYAYNNASEYFEENHLGPILRLQISEAVKEEARLENEGMEPGQA